MILHNQKVAVRNLMKYKLQNAISIACIAIGIVTVALAHSFMGNMQLPAIYYQPFHDRAYKIDFKTINGEKNKVKNNDLIKVLKQNGGLKSAERIAAAESANYWGYEVEFHMQDSTVRKGSIRSGFIDPEYLAYAGFRSAITGENIKSIKPGEAIISDKEAKRFFNDKNPIGSIQVMTDPMRPIPVKIIDVYKSSFSYDKQYDHDGLFFCLSDNIENQDLNYTWLRWINVVLKEGYNKNQLLNEINQRVEPLGLRADLSKALNEEELFAYYAVKGLIYLISSLILLAAIIGFLKIQTQLFMLRGREMTIRLVNGANWMNQFGLFVSEVAIPIVFSIMLSVLLGYILQDAINTTLHALVQQKEFFVLDLWQYSLIIGGGLLAICCLIAWIILRKIRKTGQGLAANMRKQRNHIFRNAMLGIQITISFLFVCCTFIVVKGSNRLSMACNVPDNDSFYKECLYLHTELAENPQRLIEEIKRLPEVKNIYMCGIEGYRIKDVEENPEVLEHFHNNNKYDFQSYTTDDPNIISFYGIDMEWINRDIDRNECILVSENLYRQLQEFGMQDKNTLSLNTWNDEEYITFPIAGVIKNIPYDIDNEALVVISSHWKKNKPTPYVIVPKSGKGKSLAKTVNETIKRLEPENMNTMISNFRSTVNMKVEMSEYFKTLSWTLCGVSLLICAMSILSTVSLDTRGRRKEVAIRRVNGAKSRDIYSLFGKVYLLMIAVSLIFTIPVGFIFNRLVNMIVNGSNHDSMISPIGPILLGIGIVTLIIFLIVGWQINRVVKVEPAKIIANE